MKEWLAANAWWILQAFGLLVITSNNVLARFWGFGWGIYAYNLTTAVLVTAWCFAWTYANAPSFFQNWFLATTLIALYGFAASVFILGEAITLIKLIGAALALVAAVLLIM